MGQGGVAWREWDREAVGREATGSHTTPTHQYTHTHTIMPANASGHISRCMYVHTYVHICMYTCIHTDYAS